MREILLNKFKASDDWGQPTDQLLELVGRAENARTGSFQLYHFDDPSDKRPLDTLGKIRWDKTAEDEETLDDGRKAQDRFVQHHGQRRPGHEDV